MRLKFLDRENEIKRLSLAFAAPEGTFCCLYGRRRCGKSRLLREILTEKRSIYFMADEREPTIQRSALATSISGLLPGFDSVAYPDWDSLFHRWWQDSAPGTILAIDEFPYLVKTSSELPSILQRLVDQYQQKPVHLIVAGSSQRMMMGMVLDANAPLYGRAREIIKINPLRAGWIGKALKLRDISKCLDAYAFWGGIPHYWELANERGGGWAAVVDLVLDPMGVLHNEPTRLLLDDLKETTQAASILSLIGQGCHRISEIAARLNKPTTSLTRPMQRLIELGLIKRERPFGASPRKGKKALYRLDDPFLAFWFRYVEPNRSRLEIGATAAVQKEIQAHFNIYRGQTWESLVRDAVPLLSIEDKQWLPAHRWWGAGKDKTPLEIDILSESSDRQWLLAGEVKSTLKSQMTDGVLAKLKQKTDQLPMAHNYSGIIHKLFVVDGASHDQRRIVSGNAVFSALK